MAALAAALEEDIDRRIGEVVVEPVTRVAGALGLRIHCDATERRYSGARCAARHFRGYETILVDRDVRDAIYLASRCCGYHGGQHAVASAQAVEMAFGLEPPPMAIALRNLGLSAELIHAEAAHLFLLAAPDLGAAAAAAHFPDVWALAQRTTAPHADVHGMATIAEIMRSLDPLSGSWYRDAFSVARIPLQMYAVLHGKYPHPQTMVPGGVATKMSHTTVSAVHDYVVRLLSLVDPAKRVATMVSDLLDFWVEAAPDLVRVGAGPANFVDSGLWDDPEGGADPTWEGITQRGHHRWAAPGVILDGKPVTFDLREVAEGIEEDVTYSFYEPWPGGAHPFDKRTVAAPGPARWNGRYSWATTVRWRGHTVETGPGARLWTTALRGRMPENPFVTARDGGVQLYLPEGALPDLLLEWRPPAAWNAIERTRARLYGIVFAALIGAQQALTVLDLQKQARHQTSIAVRELDARGERRGVGFAGDGLLGHWMIVDGRRIANYQVVAPSTINLGPGGPIEAALEATPVLQTDGLVSGIEALIALRSFDPCVNCASH